MVKLLLILTILEGASDSRITETEIGRYCITKPFFDDAMEHIRTYNPKCPYQWKDMTNPRKAQVVVLAYFQRYAKGEKDITKLAALFRKGPTGMNTKTGREYGVRAKRIYERYSEADCRRMVQKAKKNFTSCKN